jgi:putative FmdB family regulatory protein
MPIFEYRCQECGTEFDELESVENRDAPHECPKCGSEKSERLMSLFSTGSGGEGGGKICPSSGST